jgi:hypothetical protein
MRPLIKTEAGALALIASTYSDQRPDIHEPLALDEWQAWGDMIFEAPATSCLARFYLVVDEVPAWNSEDHLEELEEYHIESLGEDAAQERQEALRQGAPLTDEEAEEFARVWEESAYSRGLSIYYLHRVGPPFNTSDETRSIYFLSLHNEMGQYSDLEEVTGPLRSLDEVLECFPVDRRSLYEFDDSMTEGEGKDLQRWFFPQAT